MNPRFGLDGCAHSRLHGRATCAADLSAPVEACLPRENRTLLSPVLEGSISFRHEGCFEHAQLRV